MGNSDLNSLSHTIWVLAEIQVKELKTEGFQKWIIVQGLVNVLLV